MKILTKYVKNKIKELSFDNAGDRKYIDDLMYIEDKISTPAANWGYAGAMCFHWKRQEHPEEHDEIYKELNPEGFKMILKNREEQKEKDKKMFEKVRKIRDKKTKELKEVWLKAGGK